MPAATVKSKSEGAQPVTTPEPTDLGEKVMLIVEKKIRNLEKRKSKLEQYENEERKGKELNEDQKAAVSKKTEVDQQLDYVRDLFKSIQQCQLEHRRAAKAAAKKELQEKQQLELQRLRRLLQYQHVLDLIGNDKHRSNFENGTNGAVKLSKQEILTCDSLFEILCPSCEDVPTEGDAWSKRLDEGAQLAQLILQASNKPAPQLNLPCKDLRALLERLSNCDYVRLNANNRSQTQTPDNQVKSDAASTVSSDEASVPQRVNAAAADPVVTFTNGEQQPTVQEGGKAEGFNFMQEEQQGSAAMLSAVDLSSVPPAAAYADTVPSAVPSYALAFTGGFPAQPMFVDREISDPPPPIPMPQQGEGTNRSSPDSSKGLDPNAQPFVSQGDSPAADDPRQQSTEEEGVSGGGRRGGGAWRGGRGDGRGLPNNRSSAFRGPRNARGGGYRGNRGGGGRGDFRGAGAGRGRVRADGR